MKTVGVDRFTIGLQRRHLADCQPLRVRNAAGSEAQKMCGFDIAGTACSARQGVAQQPDQTAGRPDVGGGVALSRMQLLDRHPIQISTIEREMLSSKPLD